MCKQVLQNRLCATAGKTTTRSSGEAYGVPGSDLRYLKASDSRLHWQVRRPHGVICTLPSDRIKTFG